MRCSRKLVAFWWLAWLLAAGAVRAETVIWSDNFDTNGASRWSASATGVWKISSPTAGPALGSSGFRTHSGADCASSQGYAYNKDVRLVCTSYNGTNSLIIPPANEYPRLRFWQWFNYANALGYVEISTNSGGSWTQISPTYEDINGGGVWSRPYVDLSAYAGASARIAFHFTSGGCCGNALGWFVDDVAVVTGVPILNFPESFESDPKSSDWSVDFGTWEIGNPKSGPGAAHTGTNCAATVLAGNYSNNVNSRLVSPLFVVPTNDSPALRFSQWYNFKNALGDVELNNGTITITTVTNIVITVVTNLTLNTNIYQFFGSKDASYAAPLYWNPTIGGWTNATKALGSTLDRTYGAYYFEVGIAPLSSVGGPNGADGLNVDYRPTNNTIIPLPQSTTPTNFIAMEGLAWSPVADVDTTDIPIGYFGTNYTTTYSTNITVTTGQSSWIQISPTYEDNTSGEVWTNTSLDLSAYAGQTVFIAFHFTSGGTYSAPGWYVDDLSLTAAPELFESTNLTVDAGDVYTNVLSASNLYLPNAIYQYQLVSGPANAVVTNGMVIWPTSSNLPSSEVTFTVAMADNSVPPLGATNSFTVAVVNSSILTVPPAQTIYAGETLVVTVSATNELSGTDTYTYSLLPTTITNLDTSDLGSDGVLSWPTLTTQKPGTNTIGILAVDNNTSNSSATNSFTVVVLKPSPPALTIPSTQMIYAGQTLDLLVTATNKLMTNSIFNSFTYTATSSPTGVSIDPSSGKLTYPTTPTNKTGTLSITVVATDDATPPLSATGSLRVTVSPTPASTLNVPATQTNYAGMTLTVTNSATNVALSAVTFTFRLPSPSTNYYVTTNGVLTWTNTGVRNGILVWSNNSVAPGTQVITVAADGAVANYAAMHVTNRFDMVFRPPYPPTLLGPTNLALYAGERLVVTNTATNRYVLLAQAAYAFKMTSTNALVTPNGVMTWTNTAVLPGIYGLSLKVTDNSQPPLLATNVLSVSVLPLPTQLALTNLAFLTNGGRQFKFSIQTPWTNTPWRIEAATNLNATADWLPVYTNKTGTGGNLLFTDRLATNFLQRFYRVVFP